MEEELLMGAGTGVERVTNCREGKEVATELEEDSPDRVEEED